MPRERLAEQFDRFAAGIEAIVPTWLKSEDLRLKFADSVAPKFGVNAQVLLTRLDREGLWSAP